MIEINKGLNLDLEHINLPTGSWIDAKNVIRQPGKGITNHKGFTNKYLFEDARIIGNIELDDYVILFTLDQNDYFSIHTYDGTSLNTKCKTNSSDYLNINYTTKITGTYTYNYKKDVIISFFDYVNKGKPFILNLTSLPFDTNAAKEILPKTNSTLERTLELMYLQPEFETPFFGLEDVIEGGQLKCGTYQYCIQYEINSYDFINPSLKSEPILIGDVKDERIDVSSTGATRRSGVYLNNEYAQVSNKTVSLKIENLDSTFNRFKLVALFSTGESHEARTVGIYNIPSDRTITINDSGQVLFNEDYDSIVSGYARFSGIYTMSKFQSKLSLLGLNYEDDEIWIDKDAGATYQSLANDIKIILHVDQIPSSENDNGIYISKNSKHSFKNMSFCPGEVYALYIAFGKGDKISKGYHIPGRVAEDLTFDEVEINEKDIITETLVNSWHTTSVEANDELQFDIHELEVIDSPKWFQIRDYAPSGKTAYHENEDEQYPNNINFNSNYPDTPPVNSLANTNIRHHKIPGYDHICKMGLDTNLNYRISLNFDYTTITLPQSVKDKYDTVYLLYADRTSSESRVLGMSPMFSDRVIYNAKDYNDNTDLKDNDKSIRFFDNSLNLINPHISPTFVKAEFILENVNEPYPAPNNYFLEIPMDFINKSDLLTIGDVDPDNNTRIRVLDNYIYLPEGDSSKTPKNINERNVDDALVIDNREKSVALLLNSVDDTLLESTKVDSSMGTYIIHHNSKFTFSTKLLRLYADSAKTKYNSIHLGTLLSLKPSYYINFNNKNLIRANCLSFTNSRNGVLLSEIESGTPLTDKRFLGDSYFNNEYAKTKITYYTGVDFVEYGEYIVTSFSFCFPNYSKVNSCYAKNNAGNRDNPQLEYNPVFSLRNGIDHFTPSNLELKNVTEINTRFTRSAVLGTEAKELGWRKFNLLEYFDFPSDAGTATYLFGGDRTILFGFNKDIYIAEVKETLDTGGGQTLALRTNNLFDTSPIRIQDTFERSVHIQNRDNIFITKYGFVFYDDINEIIYLFDTKSAPFPISKLGMNNYLKSLDINAVVGRYDEETDHIFFTIWGNEISSWSYYLTEKQLVSTYDFNLNNYFNIKEQTYGYKNISDDTQIVKFNNDTNYGKYFDTTYTSYIDIVFADNVTLSKVLESIVWNNEIALGNQKYWDKHIKNLIIYNDYTCAVNGEFDKYIKYINGNYHLNRIKDQKYNRNDILLLSDNSINPNIVAEYPIPDGNELPLNRKYYVLFGSVDHDGNTYSTGDIFIPVNDAPVTFVDLNSIIYSVKNKFEKSNIICKFAILRFILNDASTPNYKVILNDIIVNYTKSI